MCEVCRLVDDLIETMLESELPVDQQAMAAFRFAALVAVAGGVKRPGMVLDGFVAVTQAQEPEGTH